MIQTLIELRITARILNEGETEVREVSVKPSEELKHLLVRTYGGLLLERALPEFARDNGSHPDHCLCDVCVCHKTGEHHVWRRRRDGRECVDCGERRFGGSPEFGGEDALPKP